jgi:hypothetical protein
MDSKNALTESPHGDHGERILLAGMKQHALVAAPFVFTGHPWIDHVFFGKMNLYSLEKGTCTP